MRTQTLLRISVYVCGIALIIIVLTLSLTRQHLYAPSSQDLQARRNLSVSERVNELSTWPPTPDNPLYPIRMLDDQLQLRFASPESRLRLKLKFSAERLSSAQILLDHQRSSLALSTLTKSTKYVLSAAQDAMTLSPQSSTEIRGEVRDAITLQIAALERLKPSFSDEQKPIVDRLLSELTALNAAFL